MVAYQQAQATAMQNKLRYACSVYQCILECVSRVVHCPKPSTTHYQLLRDTYSQPAVKSLREIRCSVLYGFGGAYISDVIFLVAY